MLTTSLKERFGICQWFHFHDRVTVRRCTSLLRELGIRHLRTGISWADYHRPGACDWYGWMLDQLSDFEILLSVWHTPPSLSEDGRCSSPPRRLLDYADFIDLIITNHGDSFHSLELWNEPNNSYKWDFTNHDPDWSKFAEMIGAAGYWAKKRNIRTVLGGMMPVDPHWLEIMARHGVLDVVDCIGIHGFPGMWWLDQPNWDWYCRWTGWEEKIKSIQNITNRHSVWITETGLATWDMAELVPGRFQLQEFRLVEASRAPAERTYWYSLLDLDPRRAAIEGFHVDENEYHLGLVTHDGIRKPAFRLLARMLNGASELTIPTRSRSPVGF